MGSSYAGSSVLVVLLGALVSVPALAQGQTTGTPPAQDAPPPVTATMTFDNAVQQAIQNNPTVAAAAGGILRADALLREAGAATHLVVNGNVTTTTLNRGSSYQGVTVTPQNSATAALSVQYPLYAPVLWAERSQAADAKTVAQLTAEDARRQVGTAAADAYLTVIARHRTLDAQVRARDTAKAHYDLAAEMEQAGAGSKLNTLRAEEEWTTDQGLVESARMDLYSAQEALGVLTVAGGPVDTSGEPTLETPAAATANTASLIQGRTDIRLFNEQLQAATNVLQASSKDRLPSLTAVFQPQVAYPSQFFAPVASWRFLLQGSIPIFDSGQRSGQRAMRQAAVDVARANLASSTNQAESDIRTARAAVASAERGLSSAQAAADQAHQVVDIVNISFRAGASTEIEVIDAERSARDADTTVATAEDTLRRARLELLIALGLFPR